MSIFRRITFALLPLALPLLAAAQLPRSRMTCRR
jgi:hypothetical protein